MTWAKGRCLPTDPPSHPMWYQFRKMDQSYFFFFCYSIKVTLAWHLRIFSIAWKLNERAKRGQLEKWDPIRQTFTEGLDVCSPGSCTLWRKHWRFKRWSLPWEKTHNSITHTRQHRMLIRTLPRAHPQWVPKTQGLEKSPRRFHGDLWPELVSFFISLQF